jgi:hypothetical protein
VHEREFNKGNRDRAMLAVVRRLVAYMMAVDKSQTDFVLREKRKRHEKKKTYAC